MKIKKFFTVSIIFGSIVSISYVIYRKMMNYITLDEESEYVFESLRKNNKILNNFMMIFGIVLIIISILGIIITLRAFSNNKKIPKKRRIKKNPKYEDIYS